MCSLTWLPAAVRTSLKSCWNAASIDPKCFKYVEGDGMSGAARTKDDRTMPCNWKSEFKFLQHVGRGVEPGPLGEDLAAPSAKTSGSINRSKDSGVRIHLSLGFRREGVLSFCVVRL